MAKTAQARKGIQTSPDGKIDQHCNVAVDVVDVVDEKNHTSPES